MNAGDALKEALGDAVEEVVDDLFACTYMFSLLSSQP